MNEVNKLLIRTYLFYFLIKLCIYWNISHYTIFKTTQKVIQLSINFYKHFYISFISLFSIRNFYCKIAKSASNFIFNIAYI